MVIFYELGKSVYLIKIITRYLDRVPINLERESFADIDKISALCFLFVAQITFLALFSCFPSYMPLSP